MAGAVAMSMLLVDPVSRTLLAAAHLVEGVPMLQVHPGVCDLCALLHQGSQPFLLRAITAVSPLKGGLHP